MQEFGFDAAVAIKAVQFELKILKDRTKKDDGKDIPMAKKLEAILGKPSKGAKRGTF